MSMLPLILQEFFTPTRVMLRRTPFWRDSFYKDLARLEEDFAKQATIQADGKEIKLHFDVQEFKPEEIKISVEGDMLTVNAKHEDKSDDNGFISREFSTTYKIPENVDVKSFVSNFSDGILSLKAPLKVPVEPPANQIPIEYKSDKKSEN